MSEKQNRQSGKIVSKLRRGPLTATLWANLSEYDQELPEGQKKRRVSRVAAAGISIVVVGVVAGPAYLPHGTPWHERSGLVRHLQQRLAWGFRARG